ncbi:MAG: diacylglycerol kinase [Rhodoferax sp.]|uniref:diacylglycerol kinase n=1 Tax=Rhodoferax sp. TaxID=50421 RepID=UPI001B61729F|nr:diacylglycerol kinase [Rhodoferax sp.]MBP8286826.1 diacylglycerol kinase [Rhodoferax sp.]MBP9734642.1 diacylglycerol kinase [Rhodoferax sp.]
MKNSPPVSPKRQGLARIWFATVYSWQGLYAAWFEPAFRQEALICLVGVPAAFWLGQNWLETGFLIACLAFVLVVELLNTGIESAIDRIGPQWHDLSKRAKDMGSAAVHISLLLCGGVWLSALWRWWTS